MIYNIICVIFITVFSYYSFMLIRRMIANNTYDKKLGIHTTGVRSWDKSGLYNRTESTPYLALDSFCNSYKMEPADKLVDFGSGRNRVSIFFYDRFNISATGIELNDNTYNEAVANNILYLNKNYNKYNTLNVEKQYAEKYEIKQDENKFFFFNPFDISIFKQVVYNIIENAILYNKVVEIILYFPLPSYTEFMNNETNFMLVNEIKPKGSIGKLEKFSIYKFTPQ